MLHLENFFEKSFALLLTTPIFSKEVKSPLLFDSTWFTIENMHIRSDAK